MGLLLLVSQTAVCSYCAGRVTAERSTVTLYCTMGLRLRVYWLSCLLWDMLVVLTQVVLTVAVLMLLGTDRLVSAPVWPTFMLLCALYGLSTLPQFYLWQAAFSTPSRAAAALLCGTVGLGVVPSVVVVSCQAYSWIQPMQWTGQLLRKTFLVFPPYAFCAALGDLALSLTRRDVYTSLGQSPPPLRPLEMDLSLEGGVGLHCLVLGVHAAVWLCATLVLRGTPTSLCRLGFRKKHPAIEPLAAKGQTSCQTFNASNDHKQNSRVEETSTEKGEGGGRQGVLRMRGVSHLVPSPSGPHLALDSVDLTVARGECVCVVGANGAGKSSLLRGAVGGFIPDAGEIEVLDKPLPWESTSCCGVGSEGGVGYCPQSNEALSGHLTCQQHLTVACLLRGVPDRYQVTCSALDGTGLMPWRDVRTCELSHGTRRRLCVALALVGRPALLVLDAPTSGVDAGSKEGILSLLKSIAKEGNRSVLMTSHCLDDISRLSDRVVVLASGRVVALGSVSDVVHRYGDYVTVTLKASVTDATAQAAILEAVTAAVPALMVQWRSSCTLVLRSISAQTSLHSLFAALHGLSSMGVVQWVSVSSSGYEEIFRNLASLQNGSQPLRSSQAPTSTHVLSPEGSGSGTDGCASTNGRPASGRSFYDNVENESENDVFRIKMEVTPDVVLHGIERDFSAQADNITQF